MTQDVFILLWAGERGNAAEDFVFTRPAGNPVLDFRERWENPTTLASFALVCCSMIRNVFCEFRGKEFFNTHA